MKRVLIIGADFAPSSLPPALRIRFFARHLPEFGWQPVILTTDAKHYEWSVDEENNRLLPESLKVIRTPALSARVTRKVGLGDIGIRSLWHHWRELKDYCRARPVDLIFIPVPPYAPMVLGRMAYRRFGIPYVIDYIDPWVTEYYWKLPRAQRPPKWALAYAMARVLEPFALKHVAHITGVSEGTTASVIGHYSWLNEADASVMPYGGELSDFDYILAHPRTQSIYDPNDGRLHIVYVGAFIPPMYAAARALFAAIRLGRERAPELFARLRLHFVGTTYAPDAAGQYQVLPLASASGVADLVGEQPARIPYLESLQVLMDAHGLVALGSEEPHYTASKIFPYILARRPLLAIFHAASSVVAILRETEAGTVVTFDEQRGPAQSIEAIYQGLAEILAAPRAQQPATRWERFAPYSTRNMAAQLAGVFDAVLKQSNDPQHQEAMAITGQPVSAGK